MIVIRSRCVVGCIMMLVLEGPAIGDSGWARRSLMGVIASRDHASATLQRRLAD